jgi:hypothetical protein
VAARPGQVPAQGALARRGVVAACVCALHGAVIPVLPRFVQHTPCLFSVHMCVIFVMPRRLPDIGSSSESDIGTHEVIPSPRAACMHTVTVHHHLFTCTSSVRAICVRTSCQGPPYLLCTPRFRHLNAVLVVRLLTCTLPHSVQYPFCLSLPSMPARSPCVRRISIHTQAAREAARNRLVLRVRDLHVAALYIIACLHAHRSPRLLSAAPAPARRTPAAARPPRPRPAAAR